MLACFYPGSRVILGLVFVSVFWFFTFRQLRYYWQSNPVPSSLVLCFISMLEALIHTLQKLILNITYDGSTYSIR